MRRREGFDTRYAGNKGTTARSPPSGGRCYKTWACAISAEIGKNSCTFLANEDPVAVFEGDLIHAGRIGGVNERPVGRAAIDENDFVVEWNDPGVLFGD